MHNSRHKYKPNRTILHHNTTSEEPSLFSFFSVTMNIKTLDDSMLGIKFLVR
jgi:hypothetical protein